MYKKQKRISFVTPFFIVMILLIFVTEMPLSLFYFFLSSALWFSSLILTITILEPQRIV